MPITIKIIPVISWHKTVDLIVGIGLHDFPVLKYMKIFSNLLCPSSFGFFRV